jgi:hypothetical protein
MSQNHDIIDNNALDHILTDASEGYGDLVAASVVHNVSVKALQSRLRRNQETEALCSQKNETLAASTESG